MFPATVITLNPINPSAFSTTKGDASARNLNETIYCNGKIIFLSYNREVNHYCHHSCRFYEIFPENYFILLNNVKCY